MAPFVAAKPLYGLTPMQIVAEVRAAFHDPNPRAAVAASPPPSNGGLHEIADIKVFKRDYTITFVGTDAVQGHACYHLALLPTRSPHDYRLRDIWIDRATGATRKLREAINFKNGPGTDVPWTITFARIDGAQYVARERADAPMSYRGLVYAHASVAFIGVAATTALPPTMIVPATADLILNEPLKP